ncbi:MAG: hypothetical protein AB1696_21445, partial [Planctomycetota bacterium]
MFLPPGGLPAIRSEVWRLQLHCNHLAKYVIPAKGDFQKVSRAEIFGQVAICLIYTRSFDESVREEKALML